MQFILPAKYQSINDCPKPLDPNVKLIELKERIYAVRTFSGSWTLDSSKSVKEELIKVLDEEKV